VQTIDEIQLLSFTVNPEIDNVAALATYAAAHHAINSKWHFLTGPKNEIYDLARRGYLVTALQGDGGPNDFIHTEMFVLVDHQNRIRGYYDGTSATAVDSLIDDIKVLVKEEILPKKRK
jgi:protein SCO1/2